MPLADLLHCEGIEDPRPSSHCSLLRVMLHNLLLGLDRDHIDRDALIGVFDELLDDIAARAAGPPLHVDEAYVMLVAILTRESPALFFSRDKPLVSYLAERPISYQPSWAFKFWLHEDLVHEARLKVHTPAQVASLVRDFEKPEKRKADATVGYPVLWLTPLAGPVRDIVREAREAYLDSGFSILEERDYAQRLRDLLGVERRAFPERAVAMMVDDTIGNLLAEAESVVLAAPRDRPPPKRAFAAPTQFDAGDYPRFRHWPSEDDLVEPDYGRTWDISAPAVTVSRAGVPEIVSEPLPLDKIPRAVSLGPIRTVAATEEEAIGRNQAFADALCGPTTLRALVLSLADRLQL